MLARGVGLSCPLPLFLLKREKKKRTFRTITRPFGHGISNPTHSFVEFDLPQIAENKQHQQILRYAQ